MKNLECWRLNFALWFAFLAIGIIWSQEKPQAAAPAQSQPAQHQTESQTAEGESQHSETSAEAAAGDPNSAAGMILEHATEKAVHRSEAWGRKIGISRDTSYWISLALNFGGISVLFYVLLKSKLPQMFRERTNTIQKALKEARAVSTEASRRLSDIEARLSRLDSEVSNIRAEAEREAAVEEERMRTGAEEDKRKVVEAAESEIVAIARSARHDLKSFAASLAVDLACRRIKVDDNTDQALVRQFVSHLGKDSE
jgi:F-type H+-transporting ATPase subunit b